MKKAILFILFFGLQLALIAQENCSNGVDDDGDGLIDLQDPDCQCEGIHPWVTTDHLPNPNFDDKLCCPPSFSQMACLKNWSHGTKGTADFLNTCAFVIPAIVEANLLPFPSDSGAVGIIVSKLWSEFVATCTTTPLLAGQPYRLTFQIASIPVTNQGDQCNDGIIFYPVLDLAIWGNPACNFPVETPGCPGSADSTWTVLGSTTYQPDSKWNSFSITFTPSQDMNGVMIGPTCDIPEMGYSGSPCYPYFVLDNLVLESADEIDQISISDSGFSNKDSYALLAETNDSGGIWQWYFEGVAISGQNTAEFYFKTNDYQPGTYQVTYTKDGKCLLDSFLIELPPPIAFADEVDLRQDTLFFQNRSKYALEYIWHFGDGITSMEEEPLFHSYPGAGIYGGFLVASNHCCSDTFFFTVPIFQLPFLHDSIIHPYICETPGSIDLNILSSTPISCVWSTGQMTTIPSLAGLSPGQYSVEVTNQGGQSTWFGEFIIDSLSSSFPGAMVIDTVSTCTDPATGVIQIDPPGPDSFYLFNWSHDPDWTFNIAEDLLPGDYAISVSDINGCSWSLQLNLADQGPFMETFLLNPPLCAGTNSGTLDLQVIGPNGPFNIFVQDVFTSIELSPPYQLGRGDYRILVTDTKGCMTTMDFQVVDPPAMQIDILVSLDSDGQPTILNTKVSQGAPPYTFLWSDGNTNPVRTGLPSGIYQVTVTDGIGCTRVKEVKYGLPGGGFVGNSGLQIEVIPGSTDLRMTLSEGFTSSSKIDIYDLQGRLVHSVQVPEYQLEVMTRLPHSGRYWITIQSPEGVHATQSIFVP